MNCNRYIVVVIMGVIALSGCNSFLNQKPQDFVSSSTFYKNKNQIDEALNGAYNGFQTLYGTGTAFWAMAEERSDNTTFEYNVADRGALQREEIDYFMVTTDNNYIRDVWSSIYNTVEQCNTILDQVSNVKMASSDKNQIIGQAEFIRALCYFNLVRLWGNVPLITKAITSPDQTSTIKQATPSQVYAQIIKDAKDAASKLPATWSSDQVGRVTQGAAYTLLGDVYMTMGQPGNDGNYNNAISYFNKVIQSGDYSLMPDYAQLWDPANKNNSESIFEIQFNAGIQGEWSDYIDSFIPIGSGTTTAGYPVYEGTSGRNIPTRDMINSYEKGDMRKNASIAWYVNPDNTKYAEAQHDSIPWCNKYSAKPAIQNEQNVDFYVYRYAQVLLWQAEALNEVGKTSQAYPYINKVRERAGLNDLAAGLSQTQFRTAVYHEERVESVFEDHRWFQLLRTGKAISVMAKNGSEQKTYQTWLPAGSYDVTKDKLLYPIPIHDVQLNKNLTQNPGW
ncbi:MAG TPA: RagB/SusD family nutrient uptake outer membrane protein [Balneolales bacterium]|nr:RagB/SusD family nutrient uptake outer membrane protein [Balneolales bacterium]